MQTNDPNVRSKHKHRKKKVTTFVQVEDTSVHHPTLKVIFY